MFQGNIGDGNPSAADYIPLVIPSGTTVTVTNMAASVANVNYYGDADDSALAGTITPGSNAQFSTSPVWIAADPATGGLASIQITGGNY